MQKSALLAVAAIALIAVVGYVVLSGGESTDATAGSAPADVGAPALPGGPARLTTAAGPAAPAAEATGVEAQDGRRELAASASSADEEQDEPVGPLFRGRVVDQAGRGVGDAEVKLIASEASRAAGVIGVLGNIMTPSKSATTDAMGRYRIESPGGSTVEIEVLADGFEPYSLSDVPLPDRIDIPFEDVVLSYGPVLHGVVIDDRGAPIAGAGLELVDPDRGFNFNFGPGGSDFDVVTDENGAFEVARLDIGKWGLRVEAEGHPTRMFRGTTERAGRLLQPLELVIPRGGTIRGVVNGLPDGKREDLRVLAKPSEGGGFPAIVAGGAPQAELDEDGTFELGGLDPAREYDVEVIERGRGAFAMMGSGASRSESVAALPGADGVELTFRQPARVLFKVVDGASGEPVESFTARLGMAFNQRRIEGPDGEERTNHPGGAATFEDLFPSDFAFFGSDGDGVRLMVQTDGYAAARETVEGLDEGAVIDLGTIALTPAPLITLIVTDAETGDPIRNARIRLEPQPMESDEENASFWMERMELAGQVKKAKTDSDGRAEIQSIPDRPCKLKVDRSGYAEHVVHDLVVTTTAVTREVALGRGGEVEVFVVDTSGARQAGVIVSHRAPEEDETNSTRNTSKRNGARFRNLIPGAHRFRVSNGRNEDRNNWRRVSTTGDDDGWVTVSVGNGSALEVTLQVRPASAIAGIVRQAGKPLAGARVVANHVEDDDDLEQERANMLTRERSWGDEQATTDGGGEFLLEGLEPGTYLVAVTHGSRSQATVEEVEVGNEQATLTIDLPLCAVEGRVVDGSGRGVAGVTVRVLPESRRFDEPDNDRGGFARNTGIEVVDFGVVGGGGPIGDTDRSVTDAEGNFRLEGLTPDVSLVVRVDGELITPAVSRAFELDEDEVKTGIELAVEEAGVVIVEPILAETEGNGFVWVSVTARPSKKLNPDVMSQTLAAASEGGQSDGEAGATVLPVQMRSGFSFGGGPVELKGLAPGLWTITATQGGPGNDDEQPQGTVEVEVISGEKIRVDVPLM